MFDLRKRVYFKQTGARFAGGIVLPLCFMALTSCTETATYDITAEYAQRGLTTINIDGRDVLVVPLAEKGTNVYLAGPKGAGTRPSSIGVGPRTLTLHERNLIAIGLATKCSIDPKTVRHEQRNSIAAVVCDRS